MFDWLGFSIKPLSRSIQATTASQAFWPTSAIRAIRCTRSSASMLQAFVTRCGVYFHLYDHILLVLITSLVCTFVRPCVQLLVFARALVHRWWAPPLICVVLVVINMLSLYVVCSSIPHAQSHSHMWLLVLTRSCSCRRVCGNECGHTCVCSCCVPGSRWQRFVSLGSSILDMQFVTCIDFWFYCVLVSDVLSQYTHIHR